MRFFTLLTLLCMFLPNVRAAEAPDVLARQVRDAETAFAKSMADRNIGAFAALIAPDAVFFGDSALRGKDAVIADWRRFFSDPAAPFSWSSESVEVLASGTLAHSSGPVLDGKGNRIGTFNSVWRREADGAWKVVFDKGCNCRCP